MQKRFDQTSQFYTDGNQSGVELNNAKPYRSLDYSTVTAATDPSIGDIYPAASSKREKRVAQYDTQWVSVDYNASLKASEKDLN